MNLVILEKMLFESAPYSYVYVYKVTSFKKSFLEGIAIFLTFKNQEKAVTNWGGGLRWAKPKIFSVLWKTCPSLFSLLVKCWDDNSEVQGSNPHGRTYTFTSLIQFKK